jgi:hypothetical protein
MLVLDSSFCSKLQLGKEKEKWMEVAEGLYV